MYKLIRYCAFYQVVLISNNKVMFKSINKRRAQEWLDVNSINAG